LIGCSEDEMLKQVQHYHTQKTKRHPELVSGTASKKLITKEYVKKDT
jgi:hypothetical protein